MVGTITSALREAIVGMRSSACFKSSRNFFGKSFPYHQRRDPDGIIDLHGPAAVIRSNSTTIVRLRADSEMRMSYYRPRRCPADRGILHYRGPIVVPPVAVPPCHGLGPSVVPPRPW